MNRNGQQSPNSGGLEGGLGQLLGVTSIGGADGQLTQSEGIAGLLNNVGNLADLNDPLSNGTAGSTLGGTTGGENPDISLSGTTGMTTGGIALPDGGNMNSANLGTDSTTESTLGLGSSSMQVRPSRSTQEPQVGMIPQAGTQTRNSFQGTTSCQQLTAQPGAGSSLTPSASSQTIPVAPADQSATSTTSQAPAVIQTPAVSKATAVSAITSTTITDSVGSTQASPTPAAASGTPSLV